jgi:hypothetical protein
MDLPGLYRSSRPSATIPRTLWCVAPLKQYALFTSSPMCRCNPASIAPGVTITFLMPHRQNRGQQVVQQSGWTSSDYGWGGSERCLRCLEPASLRRGVRFESRADARLLLLLLSRMGVTIRTLRISSKRSNNYRRYQDERYDNHHECSIRTSDVKRYAEDHWAGAETEQGHRIKRAKN